jgi:hypothetical protein
VIDDWCDYDGCWADVWEYGFEDARACNAAPAPGSALGLCAEHDPKLWADATVMAAAMAQQGGERGDIGQWRVELSRNRAHRYQLGMQVPQQPE